MIKAPKSITWRNVALFSAVAVIAVAATVLAPILAHQLQLANQERRSKALVFFAVDEGGLEPCQSEAFLGDYVRDVDAVLDSAVEGQRRVSITAITSFSPEWGIRLIGNDVYLIRFDSSLWERGSEEGHVDLSSNPMTTQVRHATLRPETALGLTTIFGSNIASAKNGAGGGADGTSFRFQMAGVGCGKTWSPDAESRAGRLVDLVLLLAKHAQLTDHYAVKQNERQILRAMHGDAGR